MWILTGIDWDDESCFEYNKENAQQELKWFQERGDNTAYIEEELI